MKSLKIYKGILNTNYNAYIEIYFVLIYRTTAKTRPTLQHKVNPE